MILASASLGTSMLDIQRPKPSQKTPTLKSPCCKSNALSQICALRHTIQALSIATLISGASQILTLRGRGPRRGAALSNVGVVENGAVLIAGGLIVAVGSQTEVAAHPSARSAQRL